MAVAVMEDKDVRALKLEKIRRRTRRSFGAFFHAWRPSRDYAYGRHTRAIIAKVQEIVEKLLRGESTYTIICVPWRHGKSDILSRRLPAWLFCHEDDRCRDLEVILVCYGASLALSFSYDVRDLMRRVGPWYGVNLEQDRTALDTWRISGRKGQLHATGLGGSYVGYGANVLLIDDPFGSRQEAESELIRERVWTSFQNDLFTRLSPVHAVLLLNNRWHTDDMVGRIINKNTPGHKDYDPHFPKFEVLTFPALSEDGQWLFTERYSVDWYERLRSVMGEYAWESQAQQNPVPRKGNMIRIDMINWIEASELPAGLRWIRGWDLASTAKQLKKADPDYTHGTLAAYDRISDRLYVRHAYGGQWSAMERDKRITTQALVDGREVQVNVEAVGGYIDTFQRLRHGLKGFKVVMIPARLDLVARASLIEPLFEGGNVFAVKGSWNDQWHADLAPFPGGKHDDAVASLLAAVEGAVKGSNRMEVSR